MCLFSTLTFIGIPKTEDNWTNEIMSSEIKLKIVHLKNSRWKSRIYSESKFKEALRQQAHIDDVVGGQRTISITLHVCLIFISSFFDSYTHEG